ncbi:dihydrodipicolinate synthase family protein [Streptomyces sp. NPDC057363]|uniref:dihydrodipicolinate synthase family protein n=1 Tax=Streptomyces sp. NPDC057363 TaxID=3346107 RepID=UPI003632208D
MSVKLEGVLTALPTPFDDSQKIDVPLLQKVIDRNVDAGVDALVAGGGTGEVGSLDDDERKQLFTAAAEHTAGRIPLVANVGSLTARRTIGLARSAEASGADALMLIAPFYEPLSLNEITAYFEKVAAATKLPIMLYNNPGVAGVNLDAETLARFGREIENVQYVKDSSQDWEQALRLIHHHSDDIGLIMGWDSYSFSALLEGATGIMAGAANVVPDEIVAVRRAIRDGDIERARTAWRRVYPVIDAMLALPFTQAVKAGMQLRGVGIGAPREPLRKLSTDQVADLEAALARLDG